MAIIKCPRTGKSFDERYGAISRRDNKTKIHPDAGLMEALEDAGFIPKYSGKPYWKQTKKGK